MHATRNANAAVLAVALAAGLTLPMSASAQTSKVSNGAQTDADDIIARPTTQVSCQAGTQPDDFKLSNSGLRALTSAVDVLLSDLKRGVDAYTATDDLWEWLAAAFGDCHARKEKAFFLGSAPLVDVLRDATPVLFSRELAYLPIIWIDPNEI